MKTFKELVPSPRARAALYVLGAIVVELLVFHAGMAVGAQHPFGPGFDREWGFRAPGVGYVRMPHGFVLSGHGAVGIVQSAASSSLILQTRDGSIETVELGSTTVMSDGGAVASGTSALHPGLRVIILGRPSAGGAIDADLVRILMDAPGEPR